MSRGHRIDTPDSAFASASGRAQPMGQVAARTVLGHDERFDAVPFFWSQHYDTAIKYVGRCCSFRNLSNRAGRSTVRMHRHCRSRRTHTRGRGDQPRSRDVWPRR